MFKNIDYIKSQSTKNKVIFSSQIARAASQFPLIFSSSIILSDL